MSDVSPDREGLGRDLRRLRRSRGLRIADLAALMNRSTGWISQVERGRSQPDYQDLTGFARALDMPLVELFRHEPQLEGTTCDVITAAQRRRLEADNTGAMDDLLAPVIGGVEFYHSTLGAQSASQIPSREGRLEMGLVLEGEFEIWIGGRHHVVRAGSSFWSRGEPLSWLNPHDTPCTVIWLVAPLPDDPDA
ncbi:helix-turn-helix domain-containing protein [Limimaricola litoreus]|uniref:XRE family transcriptional regulator n=1 Tax=Limimaricola litoreus TaxID=2955316 RepID=A0A9X2FM52_9RHOB|nr:XRE family transcriptional regulator [Limimaricola litoreus]MCP1167014.1 XRE family transcriptional regulator [Limimaricola litoreus]